MAQDSSFFAHLSVQETLTLDTRLRLPLSLVAVDVDAQVDSVIRRWASFFWSLPSA